MSARTVSSMHTGYGPTAFRMPRSSLLTSTAPFPDPLLPRCLVPRQLQPAPHAPQQVAAAYACVARLWRDCIQPNSILAQTRAQAQTRFPGLAGCGLRRLLHQTLSARCKGVGRPSVLDHPLAKRVRPAGYRQGIGVIGRMPE